uniref:peroxidase n=1 Tax=Betula platyphylla TaxID=78630 RepID=A0A0H4CRM3_BETPL|nr:peroxidase 2 [Betula platyphylla]
MASREHKRASLNEKLQQLRAATNSSAVTVETLERGFLINVFSEKNCPGLLVSILEAFEFLGLDVLDARVSCSDVFQLEAVGGEGCDASVLLDGSTGEKTAGPNANSLRGFDVIDTIKSQVESTCAGIVSCADILAVAARDSVVALGGPSWTVQLGRRDSTTSSQSSANSDLPAPTSDLSGIITAFSNKGFTANEMVALSGSHTIGQARCVAFRTRAYNETNIDASFQTSLQSKCPSTGGDDNLSPLDVTSPTTFDNAYFTNLKNKKGLLHSDQQLFNGGSTDSQVNTYIDNPATFKTDFANAMVKMGNLSPLTGTSGQIRTDCKKGCDASVLLDGSDGEKTAVPNNNSLRGFEVIDTIKSQVESACAGIVSCADILTVAARDSVVALGGSSWTVQLGRRDSTTSSQSGANSDLPAPTLNLSGLITAFSNKGFTANEMVALSGSHTIGQAKCIAFRARAYNETNIDASFQTSLQSNCPSTGGDDNLSPLDVTSPTTFDNAYFTNLKNKKGLLHSDQELYNGGSTDSQVDSYISNSTTFQTDFANAMVKMGNLSPLTGTSGQIRIDCKKVN